MRTVRLVIAFLGERYQGWQSQKKNGTVQETVEAALERILGHRANVVSSSRTDSGVHAEGMVAHFRTTSLLKDLPLRNALNFYLPKDVVVRSVRTVEKGFHARYHARSKRYRYTIWNHAVRPLTEAPYVLWHPRPLDIRKMSRAAKYFVGRRDFGAFRDSSGDGPRNAVRRIDRLLVRRTGPKIVIDIEADGFLTHMVRIIAGTLLRVGEGKMPPGDIPRILRSKDRKNAGPTAKPHALTLVKVLY